jgi:hypothetical protein
LMTENILYLSGTEPIRSGWISAETECRGQLCFDRDAGNIENKTRCKKNEEAGPEEKQISDM